MSARVSQSKQTGQSWFDWLVVLPVVALSLLFPLYLVLAPALPHRMRIW
jgi:hypothetical protein